MLIFRLATKTGLVTLVGEGESPHVQEHVLPGQDIQVVAQEPGSPVTIYAGTYGNGLFRTRDAGEKWTKLPLPESFIRAIAFSPINPKTLYVGTEPANLFVSRDGGVRSRDRPGNQSHRSIHPPGKGSDLSVTHVLRTVLPTS
jgi:hypothetical protein